MYTPPLLLLLHLVPLAFSQIFFTTDRTYSLIGLLYSEIIQREHFERLKYLRRKILLNFNLSRVHALFFFLVLRKHKLEWKEKYIRNFFDTLNNL